MVLGFGKKVKVQKTKEGSHGDHWHAVFGFDEGTDIQQCVRALWDDLRVEKEINLTYATVRAKYGVFSLLGIQGDDEIATLFPALYSAKSLPLEIIEILEWDHVDGIEAVVTGMYLDTLQISFFATDYLENKKKYRKGGSLNISLTGIAYAVDSQAALPDRYSPDFCTFVAKSPADRDDCEFISNVLSISDVNVKGESLKHLELRLYNGSAPSETADLPVITSAKNILCGSLNVGDKVKGDLWMQGRILP